MPDLPDIKFSGVQIAGQGYTCHQVWIMFQALPLEYCFFYPKKQIVFNIFELFVLYALTKPMLRDLLQFRHHQNNDLWKT